MKKSSRTLLVCSLLAPAMLVSPRGAWAEEAPATAPATQPAPEQAAATQPAAEGPGLRIHIVTTHKTYSRMGYDVFDASTRQVVASGTGADEAAGEEARAWDLPAGTYKIVPAGEPFEARVDFANVTVQEGQISDFVIVVEPESGAFRGSGPVVMELPKGTTIAGIRLALTAGGTLTFNQKVHVAGQNTGITAIGGLFGNFNLVFDRGNHFLNVTADAQLSFTDLPATSLNPTSDRLEAWALYAYNFNNPWVGPYARGGFRTKLLPGYLYLEEDTEPVGTINIVDTDGTTSAVSFGDEANADDLRIRTSEPFSPFVLQEELGANLKAVDLDLYLLSLSVATRLGYAFRQGIMTDSFVVVGDDEGTPVTLVEVPDYHTSGPVIGATASVTFARWLFGSAQFGMIVPVQNTDENAADSFAEELLIDLSGTAGFKVPILTELLFASFDYTFRLERDSFVTNRTQFDHTLMGRINVSIF